MNHNYDHHYHHHHHDIIIIIIGHHVPPFFSSLFLTDIFVALCEFDTHESLNPYHNYLDINNFIHYICQMNVMI